MDHIGYVYDDGGRSAAGYKGETRDCVTRAIAIAAELPYQSVYDSLHIALDEYWKANHHKYAMNPRQITNATTPRTGVAMPVWKQFLEDLGWTKVVTMKFGEGCKVHLRTDELPPGRLIVQCSRHLVAVIDGVLHDTHDLSRSGTRCVYSYFEPGETLDKALTG